MGELKLHDGKIVRTMTYDMSDFLRSCLAENTAKMGVVVFENVSTLFLSEQDSAQCFDEEPSWDQLLGKAEWNGKHQALKQMQQDCGKDDIALGRYAKVAPQVVMKVLYAARMARYDLLRAVNRLACCFTW